MTHCHNFCADITLKNNNCMFLTCTSVLIYFILFDVPPNIFLMIFKKFIKAFITLYNKVCHRDYSGSNSHILVPWWVVMNVSNCAALRYTVYYTTPSIVQYIH